MTRYEHPAFDPGTAFSWTLRSEEIARRRRQRDPGAGRTKFASKRRNVAQVAERATRYETPAFAPGIAFSWTLRSAEIARLHSRDSLNSDPALTHLTAIVAA
jgi:hypothetical protein